MKRLLLALFVAVLPLQLAGCPGGTPAVIRVITDCMGDQRPAIDALIAKWMQTLPTLREIELEALDKGLKIGGCAIMEWANRRLTPKPGEHALPPDDGWAIRAMVAKYRADAKIAPEVTFKTPVGNL